MKASRRATRAVTVAVPALVVLLLLSMVACAAIAEHGLAGEDAKENSESWAEWARDKVSQGIGYGIDSVKEADPQTMGNTKDAAQDVAGGNSQKASKGAGIERDATAQAYEKAKARGGDAYETARSTMTEQAKANYEAAKEELSQATGDL